MWFVSPNFVSKVECKTYRAERCRKYPTSFFTTLVSLLFFFFLSFYARTYRKKSGVRPRLVYETKVHLFTKLPEIKWNIVFIFKSYVSLFFSELFRAISMTYTVRVSSVTSSENLFCDYTYRSLPFFFRNYKKPSP